MLALTTQLTAQTSRWHKLTEWHRDFLTRLKVELVRICICNNNFEACVVMGLESCRPTPGGLSANVNPPFSSHQGTRRLTPSLQSTSPILRIPSLAPHSLAHALKSQGPATSTPHKNDTTSLDRRVTPVGDGTRCITCCGASELQGAPPGRGRSQGCDVVMISGLRSADMGSCRVER
jgi:hypothetical protein